jgi:hypothetical protein
MQRIARSKARRKGEKEVTDKLLDGNKIST